MSSGLIELLARNYSEAERILRAGYGELKRMGVTGPLVNVSVLLARALLALGELKEAEKLTIDVEQAVPVGLLDPRIKWRSIRAVIKARVSDWPEAERLIAEAMEFAQIIEQPDSRAEALLDHAEILQLMGRREAAVEQAEASYELYEKKGNISAAKRIRGAIPSIGDEDHAKQSNDA
jgi:ATP/maltotriose-dependent transcriptional regulator MalT